MLSAPDIAKTAPGGNRAGGGARRKDRMGNWRPRSIEAFAAGRRPLPGTGPVAATICEDGAHIAATLRHLARAGFATLVVFAPEIPADPPPEGPDAHLVLCRTAEPGAAEVCVNAAITRVPGRWLHPCFNAEYLFYPFAESRSVPELLRFVESERRETVAGVTVDLYGADPAAADAADAWFDAAGYFALDRKADDGTTRDRQPEIFGGLRWRFEEHVPHDRRNIDRIALFRARPGLRMQADGRLSVPEMNTRSAPWHNSTTAAVASFRTARALMALPGPHAAIDRFIWMHSRRFDWRAQQLMEAGLMEPGQWF